MVEPIISDHLSKFTLGQIKVDEKSIQQAKNDLKEVKLTAVSALNWKFFSSYTESIQEIVLKILDNTHQRSSEHLVFFCSLLVKYFKDPEAKKKKNVSQQEFKVIVKFKLIIKENNEVFVHNMTKNHTDEIIKNYNQLSSDIKNYNSKQEQETKINVEVVPVLIAKFYHGGIFGFFGEYTNLWLEKTLNFEKFCRDKEDHIESIACTDEKQLQILQDFIYEKNNKESTVCDLQGEKRTVNDPQGNKKGDFYTLCDIEYTNTLMKFKLDKEELKNKFEKDYNERHSSWCNLF